MTSRIRESGLSESVGIMLTSQRELVVVAVDGSQVRHSPVLDIGAADARPGRATEGRLISTHLLRPPCTTRPLSWRTSQPIIPLSSIPKLPLDIIRIILDYADMGTYLALCQVSRSVHSLCVEVPRVGSYTILHEQPEFETVYSAWSTIDHAVKTIELRRSANGDRFLEQGKWGASGAITRGPRGSEQGEGAC